MNSKRIVGAVLFHEFALLDVFGPLQMLGMLPDDFEIRLVTEKGGQVVSRQGPRSVSDDSFDEGLEYDILLVPGGIGTRKEVSNQVLLEWLRERAESAEFVTSVCTGSAILARAGMLDGLRATTNKMAFEWATSQGPKVVWERKARWVEDGKFFTSSGVSAGIDMTLALIARILGRAAAAEVATWTEYEWNEDPDWDPFAKVHGLV